MEGRVIDLTWMGRHDGWEDGHADEPDGSDG